MVNQENCRFFSQIFLSDLIFILVWKTRLQTDFYDFLQESVTLQKLTLHAVHFSPDIQVYDISYILIACHSTLASVLK